MAGAKEGRLRRARKGWVVAVVGERTRVVAVRLTPAEHEAWLAAAAAAGRGRLGSWVRDQVAASLTVEGAGGGATAAAGASTSPASSGLRGELVRVGNNLNQAVRVAHALTGGNSTGGAEAWVRVGTANRLETAVEEVRVVLRVVNELAAAEHHTRTRAIPAAGTRAAAAAPAARRGGRG